MPDGLNEFQELQAEKIAESVVKKLKLELVSKASCTKERSRQDIKIYTIYGIITFFGAGGMLALLKGLM